MIMSQIAQTETAGTPFTGARAASAPLHVVRLGDIGVDAASLIRDIRPAFDRTPWDMYDVNRRRAELESASMPESERRAASDAIQPHRRRAMRKYTLSHTGGSRWAIEPNDERSFTQAVKDYRSGVREFALIEPEISMHSDVLTLLASVGESVRAHRPAAKQLHAVLHQMSVIARPAQAASPAPEGVHQDGADFIVSALVVERRNVSGGVSRVREGRDGAPILEVQLGAGEGIFQADGGTNLWHEISPISLVPGADAGHRMTLGVDIHVA
jgi:hypothetical protein